VTGIGAPLARLLGRNGGPKPPGEGMPREAVMLGIALFFAIAPTNILTPLLPNIRDEFAISIATAGLVVSTYGLARLVTDLPSGVILDRIGERRLAAIGTTLLVLGSITGAVSPSVEWLILARIAAGLGSGLITTVALTGLS
jgi:predicted MFS family arabinose efflux permease